MITIKTIDILAADVDAIIHSVNCFHHMGGLAGVLAHKWQEVEEVDFNTPYGKESKLGTVSIAKIEDQTTSVKYVVNVYGQFHPGPDTRITALCSGLIAAKKELERLGVKSVGIPWKIGCGIGGGDWLSVEYAINLIFEDAPFDVIICQRPEDVQP